MTYWKSLRELPTRTEQSDMISKGLKKRGFTFIGSTICYAFMQAVGMVNDHIVGCFRYADVKKMAQQGKSSVHGNRRNLGERMNAKKKSFPKEK